MRLKSQPGILARASPSNFMRLLVLMTAAAFMSLTRAEGEGKLYFIYLVSCDNDTVCAFSNIEILLQGLRFRNETSNGALT